MDLKFKYKWPTATKSSVQQTILTNQKTGQEVHPSDQTLSIGVATVLFYFMTLVYIYGSGAIVDNEVLIGSKSFLDKLKKIISACFTSIKQGFSTKAFMKNSGSIWNLNTLSSSLKNSERIGTTVCLVVFLALIQGVFAFQNIYSTDFKKSTIVGFNYFLVLCWLLFLYIFPFKKVGGESKLSKSHLFLAVCVITSIIINCFLIANLYSDYFDSKSLEPLSGIGYALVGCAVACVLSMLISIPFNNHLTHELIAYSEMSCLVLFGIFLIVFIQFPPLPTDQLVCTMVPGSNSTPTLTPIPSSSS